MRRRANNARTSARRAHRDLCNASTNQSRMPLSLMFSQRRVIRHGPSVPAIRPRRSRLMHRIQRRVNPTLTPVLFYAVAAGVFASVESGVGLLHGVG